MFSSVSRDLSYIAGDQFSTGITTRHTNHHELNNYEEQPKEMTTNGPAISELCTRVQKLLPKSVGNDTWYLIIVSKMVSELSLFSTIFKIDTGGWQ